MSINPKKLYFMMSCRFNKTKPEEFGLKSYEKDLKLFIDEENVIWKQKDLYDLGWGREHGYIRLPELTFEDLWNLLCYSDLEINKYGAAAIIEEQFNEELLSELLLIVNDINKKNEIDLVEISRILRLQDMINRTNIIGKSLKQIEEDQNKWKYVATRI